MAAASASSGRKADSALAAALYLTALALLAQGVGEALTVGGVAAPFGSLRWRFGFVGMLFLHMPLPLLGMALGSLTAALLRHRLMLLGFAVLQGLLILAALAGFLVFALDATQIAGTVPAQLRSGYIATVVETALMGGLGIVFLLVLGLATGRALRLEPVPGRRPAGDASLVIGRG